MMYFRNYLLRKTWLDKCLKRPNTAPLPYILITAKVIELGKVSFSYMQSLKTVC